MGAAVRKNGRLSAHLGLRKAASAALAAALAAVLAFALTSPTVAFAAIDDDENVVDPTQRADNSFIYDTTISSLFEQSSLFDGRTVQIIGEAIGDRITDTSDAGRCWIMLSTADNDASSISVLMSDEQASQIDRFGRYGVTGTMLQVRGTYHQTCAEHDGLPDIHATNVAVSARGVDHPDQFVAGDFAPGAVAVIVGIALMGAFYLARERLR